MVLLALLLALFLAKGALGKVFIATWDGAISPASADYVKRTLKKSLSEGGTLYVLILNTPGGLLESARSIIQSFQTAPIPVVVYVYPPGARAASAGAIITLSADVAVMAPGTNIGSAHPVIPNKKDEVMMKKVLQDTLALVRAIAKQKGRNEKIAQKMVKESISLTAEEALKARLIDLIASSPEELLRKLHGRKVKKLGNTYEINTKGVEVVYLEPSFKENLLKIITNPTVSYILLMLGFYGIFFELYNPGAIVPGVLGAIFLLLGLYGLSLISINWLALLLIVFGILLLVLELITPAFGALALGGGVAIFLGSLFLVDETSPYGQIPRHLILSFSVLSALFFLGVGYLGMKAQRRKKLTGAEGMLGLEGEVIDDFKNGKGKVLVRGEIWNARSEKDLKRGQRVLVVGIRGLELIVRGKDESS
ncbi:MAG: nodulation protein NfeD [Aquificae bacterium]|nr:nodulation protein NfeD [Aquificota bacterium]